MPTLQPNYHREKFRSVWPFIFKNQESFRRTLPFESSSACNTRVLCSDSISSQRFLHIITTGATNVYSHYWLIPTHTKCWIEVVMYYVILGCNLAISHLTLIFIYIVYILGGYIIWQIFGEWHLKNVENSFRCCITFCIMSAQRIKC